MESPSPTAQRRFRTSVHATLAIPETNEATDMTFSRSRITLAALAVATIALSAPAEARGHHHSRHHRVISGSFAPAVAWGASNQTWGHHRATNASLRYQRARHRVVDGTSARLHYGRRGGACDGFQRCRCGTTAARHFGLPYAYKGFNLKMASEWAHAFPHTSFHIGVAGVKPHHVLAVVGGSDCHSAKVYDDAGTRQRNVCGFTFVEVSGGGFTRESSAQTRRHHSRSC
jgi:hypothetical protein